MSQINNNQFNNNNQQSYHAPKLQKFGKVSELTFANFFSGNLSTDGGTAPFSVYAS